MLRALSVLLFFSIFVLAAPAGAQNIFEVNSTADDPDNNPGNGVCRTAAGICTLRAAIEEANATPNAGGPDVIRFTSIPLSGGAAVIQLASGALPAITQTIVIDGLTAAGEVFLDGSNLPSPGTVTTASGLILDTGSGGSSIRGLTVGNFPFYGFYVKSHNNVLTSNRSGVREDGTAVGNGVVGIYLNSGYNTVGKIGLGNVVGFNGNAGIHVINGEYNLIRGNYVGTDDTGADFGNGTASSHQSYGGIVVRSNYNTIGGSEPGMGNTIGHGTANGLIIDDEHNLVRGNYIGTDAAGRNLGNASKGILLEGNNNIIGGGEPGQSNVIGFNTIGIYIWGGDNKIQGNYIGTDAAGADLGNIDDGIFLSEATATDNTIGQGKNAVIPYLTSKANTIAFNANGIGFNESGTSGAPVENTIRGNNIHDNDGLGIDLNLDGISANDVDDVDLDANATMNYPDVSRAFYRPGNNSLVVEYSVSSSDLYVPYPLTIDVYLADDATSGEGRVHIGTDTYTTPGQQVGFEIDAASVSWDASDYVVLTATDTLGNTSEFSPAAGNLGGPGFSFAVRHDDAVAPVGAFAPFTMTAPYPNPFNPRTTFALALPEATPARVSVFDITGRQVALLNDGILAGGVAHTFTLDAAGLASGVYLLRVQAGAFVETRRLALLK